MVNGCAREHKEVYEDESARALPLDLFSLEAEIKLVHTSSDMWHIRGIAWESHSQAVLALIP